MIAFIKIPLVNKIFPKTYDFFTAFVAIILVKLNSIIHFLTNYESWVDRSELFCHLVAVGDDFHQIDEEEESTESKDKNEVGFLVCLPDIAANGRPSTAVDTKNTCACK